MKDRYKHNKEVHGAVYGHKGPRKTKDATTNGNAVERLRAFNKELHSIIKDFETERDMAQSKVLELDGMIVRYKKLLINGE